jgi:predicted nucleotidyltransferase
VAGMRAEIVEYRDEPIAAAERHARNVRLFGSVATGRDDGESNVDFPVDFFEFGATLLDLGDSRDEFQ